MALLLLSHEAASVAQMRLALLVAFSYAMMPIISNTWQREAQLDRPSSSGYVHKMMIFGTLNGSGKQELFHFNVALSKSCAG